LGTAILVMANTSKLEVSGTLISQGGWYGPGNSFRPVIITSPSTSSGYNIDILSGGTSSFEYTAIVRLSTSGIIWRDGAYSAVFRKNRLGRMEDGNTLDFSEITMTYASRIVKSMDHVYFGTPSGAGGYNVKVSMGSPILRFFGKGIVFASPNTGNPETSAPRWGELYDNDPIEPSTNVAAGGDGGRVRFYYEVIRVKQLQQNGTSDGTGSDFLVSTIEDALDSNLVDDYDRFEALSNVPMVLDIDLTKNVIFSGFCLTQVALNTDPNFSGWKGIFQNCVFLNTAESGGINHTMLLNCVVFDKGAGTPTIDDSTVSAKNTIFENAANTMSNLVVDENNLFAATSGTFLNSNLGDFHLANQDNGGTTSKPSDWSGDWNDVDGLDRGTGVATDRGIDEIPATNAGSTESMEIETGGNNDAGGGTDPTGLADIPRFYYVGSRNGVKSGYLITGVGSEAPINNCRLHVVNATDMESVKSILLPGVPIYLTYRKVDSSPYKCYILVVLDTGNNTTKQVGVPDGKGDALCVVYDNGTTLTIPDGDVLSNTIWSARKFGNVEVTFPATDVTATVLRPTAGSGDWFGIQKVAISHVIGDGNATANPSTGYNSDNKIRWCRAFFVGDQTTNGVTKGTFFKVNFDAYDYFSGGSSDNFAWGSIMYDIAPNDTGWINFSAAADMAFMWGSNLPTIAVSIHQDANTTNALMVEIGKSGQTAPTSLGVWKGTQEGGQAQNTFGPRISHGGVGSVYTYQPSNGSVLYSNVTATGFAWDAHDSATPLGMSEALAYPGNGLLESTYKPFKPVVTAMRVWPSSFFLTAVEIPEFTGGTIDYEKRWIIRKIWAVDDGGNKKGARAGDGFKLRVDEDNLIVWDKSLGEAGNTGVDNEFVAAAKDPHGAWPMTSTGAPVVRICPYGGAVYWATKDGWVYGKTFNRYGHGNEGVDRPGYPYYIGTEARTVFTVPGVGFFVGTLDGKFMKFEF
jgi:hypothetical protein